MSQEDRKFLNLEALKVLLDYTNDDVSDGENTTLDLTLRTAVNLDSNAKNSCISYVRGSERDNGEKVNEKNELVSFADIFQDNGITFKTRLSFKSVEFSDSDFFDSDTGKKLLLQDEASREKFNLQNDDPNSPGCSSWTPCSRKRTSEVRFLVSDANLRNQQCISIGDYIGACSEPLGSLSCDSLRQRPSFGFITSTPITERKGFSSSILDTETNDFFDVSRINVFDKNECIVPCGTPPLLPVPLYSLPSQTKGGKSCLDEYGYYIGTTNQKNIRRLRDEERMKANRHVERLSFDSLEADKTIEKKSGHSYVNDFSAVGTDATSLKTVREDKESIVEQWTVSPQEVILDSTKGNRVLLINNSGQNLKFKTKCDGKITNICPLSGTVPAMGQIGLRILISQCAKKSNENSEDHIKIVIGKTEKNIHVKIIKDRKSKSSKERSYILF